MDAGDHPVEGGDEVVGVVEGAVEADVDLRAGEQAEAAPLPLFQARDLLDPLPEPLGGDVVAEAVAGGVVGDRQVGVAAVAAPPRPSPRACCGRRRGWCGSGGRRGCRRARPGRGACLRAPPSARRGPRAAPARCRRSRGARRPPASVAQVSTSPLSVSVIPCSETERPRATASSRSCTLWAWEPVKCWSRLPKAAGGTIRRSTEMPLWVWARTPLGPGLPAAAISGWPARCSASAAGSSAVAIRSMSLQVSAQRRTEPATSTRLAAGCSRSAAASSSAIGLTFESSSRPGPSPGSPSRSSAARMFSSAFGPRPFDVADLLRPRPRP